MITVPLSETASATGFDTLMAALGTSGAAAVIGAVLARTATTLGGFSLPSEDGFRTGLSIGGAALASEAVAARIPVVRAAQPEVEAERRLAGAEAPASPRSRTGPSCAGHRCSGHGCAARRCDPGPRDGHGRFAPPGAQ